MFRLASIDDFEVVKGLCIAYREADKQPIDPLLLETALTNALKGDPSVKIWLIECDNKPIGYIAVTFGFSIEAGGHDSFIDELFIIASERSKGIGTKALAFAEKTCREHNVCRLNLEVERHNPEAKALYARMGFRDHDRFLMSKLL